MKRIVDLILLTLCVISYTSCDNAEGIEYIQKSSVKIISRDVNFPAAASQGTIVVEAPSEFTVSTSDQGWCTTTISGSTIQVNVEQNPGLEGRNSMLTIRCGADTACVAIQQSGVIFQLSAGSQIISTDNASTFSYDIKCNTELTLEASDDWIHVTVEEGKMNVALTANNTGHIRNGSITYKAGAYQDAIKVSQCEFEKDLAGAYMLVYTNSQSGKTEYLNATLTKTGNTYSIQIASPVLTIPVTYNPATGYLTLKAGQYMGDYGTYKMHTTIWDTTAGTLTWDTNVSMSTTFEYEIEEGIGYTIAPFEDNGSWGTYRPNAIRFEAFSSTTLSSSTRIGSLLGLVSPYLLRSHEEVAPAKAMKAFTNLSFSK